MNLRTRSLRVSLRLSGVALAVLLCTGSALAFPRPTVYGQIANPHAEGTVIFWDEIQVQFVRLRVNITAPCGDFSAEFKPGETPFFDIRDIEGAPDGTYTWELATDPVVDPEVQELLIEVRGTPEEQEVVQSLWDAGKLPQGPFRQSGFFEVSGGVIVPLDEVEKTEPRLTTGTGLEARKPGGVDNSVETSEDGGLRNVAARTVLTNSDGIIRNSLCVGFDCPDNPSFSDTTILLMENNTRIKFDDTSTISGFPNRDWELQANSNSSGGGSYFAINDCGNSSQGGCAEDPLFLIEAAAPANSIRVDSSGRVGFNQANPVIELHISNGDSPGVRLDQTTASGFAAQVWDIVGNETTFFVRDATNGSQLPFRIQPGADSNSLFIESTNDVGVGTSSPTASLHVRRTSGSARVFVEEASSTTAGRVLFELSNNGATRFDIGDTSTGRTWRFANGANNFSILDLADPGTVEFLLAANGDLTITGELTTGGVTCGGGGCDLVFSPGYELNTIEEHAARMWENGYLPAVGPTPENTPFNLTEKTGGMLNELEKAHIYIEQLHNRLDDKDSRLAEVERQNEELTERLARIEALLLDPQTRD